MDSEIFGGILSEIDDSILDTSSVDKQIEFENAIINGDIKKLLEIGPVEYGVSNHYSNHRGLGDFKYELLLREIFKSDTFKDYNELDTNLFTEFTLNLQGRCLFELSRANIEIFSKLDLLTTSYYSRNDHPCNLAAQVGNLEILKILANWGYLITKNVLYIALMAGNHHIVSWITTKYKK